MTTSTKTTKTTKPSTMSLADCVRTARMVRPDASKADVDRLARALKADMASCELTDARERAAECVRLVAVYATRL